MGEINKLLIAFDGVPLIRRTAELYLSLFSSVTIVTGFEATDIEATLNGLDVKFVFNSDFETGQQSSVKCGLDSLSLEGEGVLIGLGDQPFLSKIELGNYAETFLGSPRDKVFIPYYKAARGNPILFPMTIIQHLMTTKQTGFCRKFLDNNPDLTTAYTAPTSAFIDDIDTPSDLPDFVRRQKPEKG